MKSRILHNALWLVLIQCGNYLLPLLTLPYLFRVLGTVQFGAYAFAQAVMMYFVLITEYGFNLSATRRIAESQTDRSAVSRVFWSTQAVKTILCAVAFCLLVLAIETIPRLVAERTLLLCTFPMVIGTLLFPQWLFQGLERMAIVSLCFLVSRMLGVPLIFLLVTRADQAWIAALIGAMASVVAGLLSLVVAWRLDLIGAHRPSRDDIRFSFVDGWHLFLSTAAINLYTASNTVILGFVADAHAVGLFAAADKIRNAVSGLVGQLGNAVYPRVNALVGNDRPAAITLIRKLLVWQGAGTALISIGLFVLAPWIVRFVMGEGYEGAVPVMRWLAPLVFVIGLSNVFGIQTMLPFGMKRAFSRIVLATGLLNLAVLVPLAWHLQAVGAAMAILVTEVVVTVAMALTVSRSGVPIFRWKGEHVD